MGLFDTNSNEVMRERLEVAMQAIDDSIEWLGHIREALDTALKKKDLDAFPIDWIIALQEKVSVIHNEVCRANGAALVRCTI